MTHCIFKKMIQANISNSKEHILRNKKYYLDTLINKLK